MLIIMFTRGDARMYRSAVSADIKKDSEGKWVLLVGAETTPLEERDYIQVFDMNGNELDSYEFIEEEEEEEPPDEEESPSSGTVFKVLWGLGFALLAAGFIIIKMWH